VKNPKTLAHVHRSVVEGGVGEEMGVLRGQRVRVRVVPCGERAAIVAPGQRRRDGRPRVDVPRPQRALRERAHPRHPGKWSGRGPSAGTARPHGARRPVRRAGRPVAVEVARRSRVDGRVAGGRHPRAARVHARSAARASGVRQVRRFQNERGSATGTRHYPVPK